MKGTSRGELFDELSNWNVGAGIVTMALFPLALPGIILAAALALPLLALALPFVAIGGIGLGAFRLIRGLAHLVGGFQWHGVATGRLYPSNPLLSTLKPRACSGGGAQARPCYHSPLAEGPFFRARGPDSWGRWDFSEVDWIRPSE